LPGRKRSGGKRRNLSKTVRRERVNAVPLLSIQGLNTGYGDVPILWDVSLEVRQREIVGLIGGNGAGKSTLLNVISGGVPAKQGTIRFAGQDITRSPTAKRVGLGITHVPEGRLLFSGLTVLQNLRLGAYGRNDKPAVHRDLDMVFSLLPRLAERRDQLAGTMSGGEQQMCAIGRGLMARPKLLLVDELSLGLAPLVVDHIMEALKTAYVELDLSLFIVEQDVQLGLEVSHRAYVLETGRIVKEGESADLAEDAGIKEAFMGI
jgi:branched-chain amino acid transport system ATP-binding protein